MDITGLIERCRQGNANALGELYKAYADRMRGVCLRYVSDRQTADDVLHDAFLIIFTSFDRLRDTSKAESWMMAITRNVASKYKDHLNTLPTVPLEEAEAMGEADTEADVKGIPLEEVMLQIDRLPEGYGKVFRLSVLEGLSHKEIADVLGIEPHSSSSQLARAKKMIRKMIQQYWAAVLLLLFMPVAVLLLRRANTVATKGEKPATVSSRRAPLPAHRALASQVDTPPNSIALRADSATNDTLENATAHERTAEDTTATDTAIRPTLLPHFDKADLLPDKLATRLRGKRKWSVELAYAGGMPGQYASRPYGFTETPSLSPTGEPPQPVTFKNWSDYAAYLSEMPDDATSHASRVVKGIVLNNANRSDADKLGSDEIVRRSHHQTPVKWSLALKYRPGNRFGLETGLSYSRLTSDFEMGAEGDVIREQQAVHYLGILLKGVYNVYDKDAWSLYGSVGLTAEIPVYSSLHTSYYLHGGVEATDKTTIRAPWQWSVGTGLGLQYNVTPNVGLFAEPSLQYYSPTDNPIETYYTARPLTFSLPLGIRFTW